LSEVPLTIAKDTKKTCGRPEREPVSRKGKPEKTGVQARTSGKNICKKNRREKRGTGETSLSWYLPYLIE